MTEQDKLLAEKLIWLFGSQKFFDWYNTGRFYDYISGAENPPTKDEILKEIHEMVERQRV